MLRRFWKIIGAEIPPLARFLRHYSGFASYRFDTLAVHVVMLCGIGPKQASVTLFVHEQVRVIALLEF